MEHVLGPSGRGLHRDKPEISLVADQVGCPTSTHTLAAACWRAMALVDAPIVLPAVLHWINARATSLCDVALAVGELGVELGLLERISAVNPLTTGEYPLPAQRPSKSLLDCSSRRRALGLAPTSRRCSSCWRW